MPYRLTQNVNRKFVNFYPYVDVDTIVPNLHYNIRCSKSVLRGCSKSQMVNIQYPISASEFGMEYGMERQDCDRLNYLRILTKTGGRCNPF
jgi:hypothetical protein